MHHPAYFRQFIHQIDFIVQATGRVNNNDISSLSDGRLQGVKSHRSRVCTHSLANNWHTNSFRPNCQLINSSSAECIGSTQNNCFSDSFKIVGQLSNGCCFSNSIHANYHNYIWLFSFWQFKILTISGIIFFQKCFYFFSENSIQFVGSQIFIACNPCFNPFNDFQSSAHTYI